MAHIHLASWQGSFAGLLSDAVLAAQRVEPRIERWRGYYDDYGPERFDLIAENGNGEAVGFATSGPNTSSMDGFAGELWNLHVLPDRKGQGIGTRLVAGAARGLLERGYSSMMLWTLEGNPARKFYEGLGGSLVGTQEIEIDDEPYREVAYGWNDITQLVGLTDMERE
jgi:GNAT superfamily N-acetyltransferase